MQTTDAQFWRGIIDECRQRLRKRRRRDPVELDYPDYLRTNHWKRIRKRVLVRDDYTCKRCGGRGNEVHHRSYEREVMQGKDDNQLVTLCEGCHDVIEFRDDGTPRSADEKEAVLSSPAATELPPAAKVDLRDPLTPPTKWPRLSAVQRTGWLQRQQKLLSAKREMRRRERERRAARHAGKTFGCGTADTC